MSRPSAILMLEQLEDLITPGFGSFLKNPIKEAADTISDAAKEVAEVAVHAPTSIVNTAIQVAKQPQQIVRQPAKVVGQAVKTVTNQTSETVRKVADKTEQVARKVKDTAEDVGKKAGDKAKKVGDKAEKAVREVKKGAEQVGKAAKDAYQEAKPYIKAVAPIVVGVATTVFVGPYAGAAAGSITASLINGERDFEDIAINVAKAEAVAVISSGVSLLAPELSAVESAAVTSVATDVVVNGETDPVVLLEHAAVAGATSYADGEVAKLNLGNTAETVTTTAVNQVIQSHGHIDPQAILVNAGGTLLGTEIGEYLKPVFSGTAEPVLVPEVEESVGQSPPSTELTSENGSQPQASAPTDVVIPGNETGNTTDLDPGTEQKFTSISEQPILMMPSESEFSLLATSYPDTSSAEDVVTLPVPTSEPVEPPLQLELAPPSEVIVEFAPPKTETVVQNGMSPPQGNWLVDAANSIQAYEDVASKWAVDLNEDYHLTTRAGGVFDAVTGYVGTVGAILAIPITRGATGVTAAYQADQSAAGVLTAVTGVYQPRYTEQYLPWYADLGLGMMGTPGRAVTEGIEEGAERVGKKTLEATIEVKAGRVSEAADLNSPAVAVVRESPTGSTTVAPPKFQTLYRGERASMSPDVVFSRTDEFALPPKGSNPDLLRHATSTQPDTYYVASSTVPDIAEHFAGQNGWVYVINSDRGIDVNRVLGDASPYPEQFEVALPGGVRLDEIMSVYPMKKGGVIPRSAERHGMPNRR